MRTQELAVRAATVTIAAAGVCALTSGVAAAATGSPTPLPPLPPPAPTVVTTVQQTVTTVVDKVTGTPTQQPGKPPVKAHPTGTTRHHDITWRVPPTTHPTHQAGSVSLPSPVRPSVKAEATSRPAAAAHAPLRLVNPSATSRQLLGGLLDNDSVDRHGLLLAIATLAAAVVAVGHLRVETMRWHGVTLVAVAR